jgi:hypothetical protein
MNDEIDEKEYAKLSQQLREIRIQSERAELYQYQEFFVLLNKLLDKNKEDV